MCNDWHSFIQKPRPMRISFHALILPLVLCLLPSLTTQAGIVLQPAVGTDPKLIAEVQRTIDAFNAIASEKLGVTLDKDVYVRLCPTEACYVDVLRNEAGYRDDKALLVGHVSNGLSSPGKNKVFLRLINPAGLAVARSTTAHELTHMVQGQLVGQFGGMEKANRWIKEGMADWMGGLVANRLGSQTLEKWKLDRINNLRSGGNILDPDDMDAVSFDQWTHWMDQKRMPYEMADLMVMALADKKGDDIFPALVGYMKCMETLSLESTCFRENFSFGQSDFYADYKVWLKRALANGKGLEVVADGIATESTKLVEAAFAQAQILLRERLGSELPVTLRIFLLPDRAAMGAAIARELGRTPEEADKLARGTVSMWQDSVAFFDLSRLDTPERLAAITASTTAGRYLQVVGGSKGQLPWMAYGLREYIANASLDAMGLRPMANSMQARADILRKAGKGLPTLTELHTFEDYRKAQGKYGSAIVTQYASAAVDQLVINKGATTLGSWVRASKEGTDPRAVFADSQGEPLEPLCEALDGQAKRAARVENLQAGFDGKCPPPARFDESTALTCRHAPPSQ